MFCRLISLTLIPLLLSCSTPTTPESTENRAIAESPEPESTPAAAGAPEPENSLHHVVVDLSVPGSPTFRACDGYDSGSSAPLKASPELIETLIGHADHAETASRDYLPVVLKGRLMGDSLVASTWMASDYPCERPFGEGGWSAFGDEPFWAFDFDGENGTWVMPEGWGPDGKGESMKLELVSQPDDLTGSALTWTWKGPQGKTWTVEFKEETCHDGMGSGIYTHRVEVSHPRLSYSGCGVRQW